MTSTGDRLDDDCDSAMDYDVDDDDDSAAGDDLDDDGNGATGDDDDAKCATVNNNNNNGNGAMGDEVDDDGNGATKLTMMAAAQRVTTLTTMVTARQATGCDDEDDGDGRRRGDTKKAHTKTALLHADKGVTQGCSIVQGVT
jgi:hypothetical protein